MMITIEVRVGAPPWVWSWMTGAACVHARCVIGDSSRHFSCANVTIRARKNTSPCCPLSHGPDYISSADRLRSEPYPSCASCTSELQRLVFRIVFHISITGVLVG